MSKNSVLKNVKALGMLTLASGFALGMSACHMGGQISASPATEVSSLVVSSPTIISPTTSPYYSNESTLSLMGMCMNGTIVQIMNLATRQLEQQNPCENSQYSMALSASVDGIYSYSVFQVDHKGRSSESTPLVWIRKTTVAQPSIVTPATKPFRSALGSLDITGFCESGALIAVSGDSLGYTTCLNSNFSLSIVKPADGDYTFQVIQTDLAGNSQSTTVLWNKHKLVASPSATSIVVDSTQVISISGGSGYYTVTLQENPSGATYDSNTNTYRCGSLANQTDTLLVTDTHGITTQVTLTSQAGAADHLVVVSSGPTIPTTIGAVTDPLAVKVVDAFGNGIPNYPLSFRAIHGDSQIISNPTTLTDLQGLAQVILRAGYTALLNSIEVKPTTGTLPDLALTGKSKVLLTMNSLAHGTSAFESIYSVGINPNGTVVADFDQDQKLDVIVANMGDPSLGFLKNKGHFIFDSMRLITPTCSSPAALITKDFNQDTALDLAVVCSNSDELYVYLGNNDGTFQTPLTQSTNTGVLGGPSEQQPMALASGYFDSDSLLDLAIVGTGSTNVGIWKGQSNGSFVFQAEYSVGSTPNAIAVGDFDRNGKDDFAVTSLNDNSALVFVNGGAGVGDFTNTGVLTTGANPVALTIEDFDNDGYSDLMVVNTSEGNLNYFRNDQSGNFELPVLIATGTNPISLATGALDNNNYLDLVVANSADNSIHIIMNSGGGSFNVLPPVTNIISTPVFVGLKDLDGNGAKDLVVTSSGGPVVQMLPSLPYTGGGTGGPDFGFLTRVGMNPIHSMAMDFDKDTFLDLIVADRDSNDVIYLKGYGSGLFSISHLFTSIARPTAVIAYDLNQDSNMDFMVLSESANTVKYYPGNGDGSFGAGIDYNVGLGASSLKVTDLNGDGFSDVVVANTTGNSVSILLNQGNGTLSAKVDYSTGSSPLSIVYGDFNEDQKIDLAVVNQSDNTMSVFIGNGDGTLQTKINYTTASNPAGLTLGDFNQDKIIDLVSMSPTEGVIEVFLGIGDGSFASPLSYAAGATPTVIATGDFNGDSKQDVVVGNGSSFSCTILFGNGAGQFLTSKVLSTMGEPTHLNVSDINDDGILDLLIGDSTNNLLQTFIGR